MAFLPERIDLRRPERRRGHRARPPPAHDGGAAPHQQPGFEAKLQSHRPAIQQAQQELRAARLKLRDRVTAETVDRAGIEAAYAELRTRNAAVQKAIHDAVIDASIDLPAESRRMMVRRVEEPAATMPGRARPPGVPRP